MIELRQESVIERDPSNKTRAWSWRLNEIPAGIEPRVQGPPGRVNQPARGLGYLVPHQHQRVRVIVESPSESRRYARPVAVSHFDEIAEYAYASAGLLGIEASLERVEHVVPSSLPQRLLSELLSRLDQAVL